MSQPNLMTDEQLLSQEPDSLLEQGIFTEMHCPGCNVALRIEGYWDSFKCPACGWLIVYEEL